jgi:3-phenylpropionate/trans-cinnamate dioxygenase ferredoxin subunit|tara:strand:- start:585 stop:905 length:321 start_codon:yes stop_codon:yes gene_type:complete
MNEEIEPILIGEVDDIEVGSVENFEYEDINFAIYRLESGFFATQGNCQCSERTLLSEADIDGEELECPSCGNTFSIVSGDSISDLEQAPLRIYDVTEEDGKLYLNI